MSVLPQEGLNLKERGRRGETVRHLTNWLSRLLYLFISQPQAHSTHKPPHLFHFSLFHGTDSSLSSALHLTSLFPGNSFPYSWHTFTPSLPIISLDPISPFSFIAPFPWCQFLFSLYLVPLPSLFSDLSSPWHSPIPFLSLSLFPVAVALSDLSHPWHPSLTGCVVSRFLCPDGIRRTPQPTNPPTPLHFHLHPLSILPFR